MLTTFFLSSINLACHNDDNQTDLQIQMLRLYLWDSYRRIPFPFDKQDFCSILKHYTRNLYGW